MSRDEGVMEELRAVHWYHSFEVLPGVVTPGLTSLIDAGKILNDHYGLAQDLAGLRALDIGALDGPYSFELERRGAEVTALDIQDPDHTGFNTAKRLRKSKVRYVQGSVYDLSELLREPFDIVTFLGVFYHLKNPMLAFEQLRGVLKDTGLLLIEGECLRTYATLPDGRPSDERELIEAVGDSELPLTLFYSGSYKGDRWSWFVPNVACVKEWLHAAGLELISHGVWSDHPHQRMFGAVRKMKDAKVEVDNPVW